MTNDCKRCRDRCYQIDMFTKCNNPNGYGIKYGKDHSERRTTGELVSTFRQAEAAGLTKEELADLIDREFLFGCWANELEMRNPDLLRDLRGLIVVLLRPGS